MLRASGPTGDIERLQEIAARDSYLAGDLEAEADYYRIHFRPAIRQPAHLEQVVGRLRAHFTKESVLTARAIEQRLYEQTWLSGDYDLIPELRKLTIPALVLHGDQDLVPVEMAARIAESMRGSRFVVLRECGTSATSSNPNRSTITLRL